MIRFFSTTDPQDIRRLCDVPLGKKFPMQIVGMKELALGDLAVLLHVQSLSSRMRLEKGVVIAHSADIQLLNEGEKPSWRGPDSYCAAWAVSRHRQATDVLCRFYRALTDQ